MKGASGTYGTMSVKLTFISSKSDKRRESAVWKNVWGNNGWDFPNFCKRHKSTDLSWANPNKDKFKEIDTKTNDNQSYDN